MMTFTTARTTVLYRDKVLFDIIFDILFCAFVEVSMRISDWL